VYRQETTKLHQIARSPEFRMVLKGHAEDQMLNRDVARFEVEKVLKAGAVVRIEIDPNGSERWRVAGRDADGRRIEVVIEPIPPSTAHVVTVIRVD
jgi:Domain of unknown function (DUF4258)